MAMLSVDSKTVLVIGHPGHELRVFHWVESMKPTVFIITDGSGRSGRSRLLSTTKILDQVKAPKGLFYGRYSDATVYSAILNHDFDVFINLALELAAYLIDKQVSYVAGDALEGYNPTHDACRLVIDAAVKMANRADRSGTSAIGNFAFPLTGAPDHRPEVEGSGCIDLQLDDAAFARKIAAARSYVELDSEVEAAIRQNRLEAFRVECLHPVRTLQISFGRDNKPYYERYGENQVAAGHYRDVIRYRDHFQPLADELAHQADIGI